MPEMNVAALSWAFRLALYSSWLNHPVPEGAAGSPSFSCPSPNTLSVCLCAYCPVERLHEVSVVLIAR